MACSPQAPLSMELCGQGYWSGYLLPPPGGLPNRGIVSRVSGIGRWILTTTSPGKPHEIIYTLEQSSELRLPYRGGNRRREGKKLVPGHRGAEWGQAPPAGAQSHTYSLPGGAVFPSLLPSHVWTPTFRQADLSGQHPTRASTPGPQRITLPWESHRSEWGSAHVGSE